MSDEESEKLQTYCFILLYRNMTNENEIVGVERAIRNVGFRADLQYKPTIYTELGIYRNNKFGIRPTVYTSVRKNVDGESGFEVTNLAREEWVYRYLKLIFINTSTFASVRSCGVYHNLLFYRYNSYSGAIRTML